MATPEDKVRREALDRALQFHDQSATVEAIIETAKEFEVYLKGEESA